MHSGPRILAIYQVHRMELVKYASAFAESHAQAEDIVQEAWLKFSRLDDIDLIHEPVAYFYRVVRNLAIDTRRKLAREAGRRTTAETAAALPDRQPSPEQSTLSKDELRVVLSALAELPERTQIAVRLNRMEGRKLQEVANYIGLSVTRTHMLITQAIAHCDRRRA